MKTVPKDVEKAVDTARAYLGSEKCHVRAAQRLYDRMNRQIDSVARRYNMDPDDAYRQIIAEAERRGARIPVLGKDI